MRVSIGVLPTNRTKNNCSMTDEETVRSEGKRSNNFPNRVGWLGYWLRTYSSRAHCDFSCKLSTWATSERPQASEKKSKLTKNSSHIYDRTLIEMLKTSLVGYTVYYVTGALKNVCKFQENIPLFRC